MRPRRRRYLRIPGVSGTGAPVKLDFLALPARTGQLLPTGSVLDRLNTDSGTLEVSLVDATNPVVFVAAATLGLSGAESVAELEAEIATLDHIDRIRRHAAVAMGMCTIPEDAPLSNPKIAIIAEPSSYTTLDGTTIDTSEYDLGVRMISVEQVHRAVTVTGALCTAVAQQLPGTLVADTVTTTHA